MKTERAVRRVRTRARGEASRERGFILIVVVGMLAVLVVLGLSYAEQGRVELRGAANTRDIAALDTLAEVGFQFALRALHDDQNVMRADFTPPHLTTLGGAGWTTRWGFNPDPTLAGKMPAGVDRAPSRTDAYNFQDSWRLLFWNEEMLDKGTPWGNAWGYAFKFRPGNDEQAKRSRETQRFPQPPTVLLDTVQLQPLARVRKFHINVGAWVGNIQVGITPKDGGLNLNDVYDPGTVNENPGIYETLPAGDLEGTKGVGGSWDLTLKGAEMAKVSYAAPDRRTLEYILGKVPQMAQKAKESVNFGSAGEWNYRRPLAGSTAFDNGLLNWRHVFEPYGGGQTFKWAGSVTKLWINGYNPASPGPYQRSSTGIMTSMTSGAPTTIYNVAGGTEPNRYGLECTKHIMWTALKGSAYTADGFYGFPGQGFLVAQNHYGNNESKDYIWFPTGNWTTDVRLPATDLGTGQSPAWAGGDSNMYFHGADNHFQGLGFDRMNPHRAGIDAIQTDLYWRNRYIYIGCGGYGHPKARTFQLHYINAVANGRFWTDLLAAWYFGGAPGYTNYLGSTQSSGYNNWAHLGSSYDSIGMGTHWMPPTSHVWIPGFFNNGRLSTPTQFTKSWGGYIGGPTTGRDEVSRGMSQWPGNMPPARMAATYLMPMARWPADFPGLSNAHFSFNNFRLSIRAHGIQENWGDPVNPGTANGTGYNTNRWYDAVDINNTNFAVVYGMLTVEKLPSLMNRTAVAPHLHWKARFLDAECRLSRPYRREGAGWVKSDFDYDKVNGATNSWIPVEVALKSPNPNDDGTLPPNNPPSKASLPYPNVQWDGTPGDPSGLNEPGKVAASRNLNDADARQYNPWIALRMKLNDPTKPWHPIDNTWVEPRLLRPTEPYDPLTNPMYNSQNFLDELRTKEDVRNDYIRYPWMPSLKTPFVTYNGNTYIPYGMFGYDNKDLQDWLAANPGGDWVDLIENNTGLATKYFEPGGLKNFPYMPIKNYKAVVTLGDWCKPLPFDVNITDYDPTAHISDLWANWLANPPVPGQTVFAFPSPGWEGFLFEPRWYNARTINPQFLKAMRDGPNRKAPWDVGDVVKDSMLNEVAEYFAKPGVDMTPQNPPWPGTSNTIQNAFEPDNYWDFNTHGAQDQLPSPVPAGDIDKIRAVHGGLGALTYHRYIYPDNDTDPGVPDPDVENHRRNIVWGKMDFLIPEPKIYYDMAGSVIGYGTGRPQDDVFTDCHLDRGLVSMDHANSSGGQSYEAMMARPDGARNWHDWFSQRKRAIPAEPGGVDKTTPNEYRPDDNNAGGNLKIGATLMGEGKWHSAYATTFADPPIQGISPYRYRVRGETSHTRRDVQPHSIHGLPNPDYLQNFPGYPTSYHWADQFRAYIPIQMAELDGDPIYDDPDNNPATQDNNPYPGSLKQSAKMVDDPGLPDPGKGTAASHTLINPAIPVPRASAGDDTTPPVPAVSKDEAWRITRIGQRYQEIIANEIMDYQINPWWPNPCVPIAELCVPLDKKTYPSKPRDIEVLDPSKNPNAFDPTTGATPEEIQRIGRRRWRSYVEHMLGNDKSIGARIPKYYAYFNRFWTRPNHKYVRNYVGDVYANPDVKALGEQYRPYTKAGNVAAGIPDQLMNAEESMGMFPPALQYFGQYPPARGKKPPPSNEDYSCHDRAKNFPYNAMEDQLGDDWRYLAASVVLMTEPNMQNAPARNHPFRNWADFVAFLGHLVYRAPLNPQATSELAIANSKANWNPVDGVNAYEACHGDNADTRNKGKFFDGSMIRSGPDGVVRADSLRDTIVAREGFWPLAANYGRAPDSGLDAMYPQLPPDPGWSVPEWKRRWDENRGRDEAGLRVEQHYISERAANDVLVSLSNGRIGPIDFDGDGHITMTRGKGSVIVAGTPGVNSAEGPNTKPIGDLPIMAAYDGWDPTYYRQYQMPAGYPWHRESGNDLNSKVEYEDPQVGVTANAKFWGRNIGVLSFDPLDMRLGVLPEPAADHWVPVDKSLIIRNCVTLPIKFHSNTFRITIVAELTDRERKDVFAVRRYQKVISRVPDTSVANVHGPFTGEFIEHSSRAMNGVDPELNWLGVK